MPQSSIPDASDRDVSDRAALPIATNVAGLANLAPDSKAVDWKLAFWRSEMLRRFKTDLLGNLGHELRSPLSSQIGSLDLILSGLCDSIEEVQEFASSARDSARNHLQMIADCIELSSYESHVGPLRIETVALGSVLQQVEKPIVPVARDRGIRVKWTKSEAKVRADADGLEQTLLGLTMWGIVRLVHGDLALEIASQADSVMFYLTLAGKLREKVGDRHALYWQVPQALLEAMGGQLSSEEDFPRKLVVSFQLPLGDCSPVAAVPS